MLSTLFVAPVILMALFANMYYNQQCMSVLGISYLKTGKHNNLSVYMIRPHLLLCLYWNIMFEIAISFLDISDLHLKL